MTNFRWVSEASAVQKCAELVDFDKCCKNECLLAKISFDAAANEPSLVVQVITFYHYSLFKAQHVCFPLLVPDFCADLSIQQIFEICPYVLHHTSASAPFFARMPFWALLARLTSYRSRRYIFCESDCIFLRLTTSYQRNHEKTLKAEEDWRRLIWPWLPSTPLLSASPSPLRPLRFGPVRSLVLVLKL